MIKIRLHGESREIEEMIARICNELSGIRVLSVSGHYKDRGASVYERCYLDVVLNYTRKKEKEGTEMYGCPYCETNKKYEEYCKITGKSTNGAVVCDFGYEQCQEYKNARQPIHNNGAGLIQTSIFGKSGEKPFEE